MQGDGDALVYEEKTSPTPAESQGYGAKRHQHITSRRLRPRPTWRVPERADGADLRPLAGLELIACGKASPDGSQQRQRVNTQLPSEKVHGVQRQIPLPALDTGQVARTHFQALREALLSQPPSMPDAAHSRTQNSLERV